jgi:CHASE2 domain-containing sensor protein
MSHVDGVERSPSRSEAVSRHLLASAKPSICGVVRSLRAVFLISLVMSFVSHVGWLDGFETASLDALLIARTARPSNDVLIVTIDDDDYESLFEGRSPLDTTTLARIIGALHAGRPAAIGVDIETDPIAVSAAYLPKGAAPVVWAVTPPTLAGVREAGVAVGLVEFPVDSDGVIRRYRRQHPDPQDPHRTVGSFPWALVQTICQTSRRQTLPRCQEIPRKGLDDELVLNFSGDRYSFPHIAARDALAAARGSAWSSENGPLFGKIVVLGGTFRAARDQHTTPVGPMQGVLLISQAIESELKGGGIRTSTTLAMLLVEIVGGMIVAASFWFLPLRVALWASLLGLPVLAAGSSLMVFYSLARWASFTPVMLGALIHALYDTVAHAQQA